MNETMLSESDRVALSGERGEQRKRRVRVKMGCEPSLSPSPFYFLLSQCALLYVHRPFLFSPTDVSESSKGRERGVNEGSEETSVFSFSYPFFLCCA